MLCMVLNILAWYPLRSTTTKRTGVRAAVVADPRWPAFHWGTLGVHIQPHANHTVHG